MRVPVGTRTPQRGADREWAVQQLATKYRNPAQGPDAAAHRLHKEFVTSPVFTGRWTRTPHSGHEGWRYAHRITVQPSCLACHAPKDERHAFVKKDHPEDRAYGFDDGDLQGVHAVFVPDTSVEDEF